MDANQHSASNLAIGESWFRYRFPGGSLRNRVGALVKLKERSVFAFSNYGVEAFDHSLEKYRNAVTSALNQHGNEWGNKLHPKASGSEKIA